MNPVIPQNAPDVSGGALPITDCEPIDISPLPAPWPQPIFPPAPIAPVIEEPFTTTIKL